MIKKIAVIFLLLLALPLISAQTAIPTPIQSVSTCDQLSLELKITQEAQNTRKFTQDELQAKADYFYKEFDGRIQYIEDKLDNTLNNAIVSLSLVFAGVTLFILSLYAFFARLMERARYKKLEKSITENIFREMNKKVDVQKDGYVTFRNYGQDDKQAEMQKLAEFQRQQIMKQQQQQYQSEIAMLQARIAQINAANIPQPPPMQPYPQMQPQMQQQPPVMRYQ